MCLSHTSTATRLLQPVPPVAAHSALRQAVREASLAPTDSRIRYYGRVDKVTDPAAPRMAWVMTGVGCTVTGATAISASWSAPRDGARLRVVIDGGKGDGVDASIVSIKESGMTRYTMAANLIASATYVLRVFKVTEDNSQKNSKGVLTFGGLVASAGACLVCRDGQDDNPRSRFPPGHPAA